MQINRSIINLPILNSRERDVLILRNGLNGYPPHTLSEVAAIIKPLKGNGNTQNDSGITMERVRQIEAKALQKIKKYERSKND